MFVELLCPLACTIYYPFISSKLMMTKSPLQRFFWNVTKHSGVKYKSSVEVNWTRRSTTTTNVNSFFRADSKQILKMSECQMYSNFQFQLISFDCRLKSTTRKNIPFSILLSFCTVKGTNFPHEHESNAVQYTQHTTNI